WEKAPQVQLVLVQGNRQRIVSKPGRVVDQFKCRVRNRIDRIVGGVGVHLDLQHLFATLLQERYHRVLRGNAAIRVTYASQNGQKSARRGIWHARGGGRRRPARGARTD